MPESAEIKLSVEALKSLTQYKIVWKAFPSQTGRYAKEILEGLSSFDQDITKSRATIINIQNKGKFSYWTFSNGWYMFATYGMTGQWSDSADKHSCFRFILAENDDATISNKPHLTAINFNDQRHFGTLKFTNKKEDLITKLNLLGWDGLTDKLENYLPKIISSLGHSKKPIGQVMLDQSIFCGVGNYIRAESLYRARISPWKMARNLSENEIVLICQEVQKVMEEAYQKQGATIQTYKTVDGEKGKFADFFQVYGKKIDPTGYIVKSEKMADGRTIHWCPEIQR